jgi:hypothetical protein
MRRPRVGSYARPLLSCVVGDAEVKSVDVVTEEQLERH